MAWGIGIGLAAGSVVLVTFVLALIEVHNRAEEKARYSVCAVACLPYFMLLATGNGVATVMIPLLAPAWAADAFFDPLPVWVRPLIYAFVGIFAFEGIVSRLTYTVAGRGTSTEYSFSERIKAARNSAVSAAGRREINLVEERKPQTARNLRDLLSEEVLNSYIIEYLGEDEVANIEDRARRNRASAAMLKSTALVAEKDAAMKAVVKDLKKQNRTLWWRKN